ncbi:DUF308 domain-containing protein [Leuconostocaceae bacterium ESL0723]|nr:DUF308 domain-containing protein [Leuconostocaceae bacterium ESL0723]
MKSRFNWLSALVGVFFFIVAWDIFAQPIASVISLSLLFGIMAFIRAIMVTVGAYRARKVGAMTSNWWILSVVFDLIIAFVFIFRVGIGVGTIGILFAIWFIFDAITELMSARMVGPVNRGAFWVALIFGALSLVLGIILLFSPLMAATVLVYVIAFYFLIFGITLFARAF